MEELSKVMDKTKQRQQAFNFRQFDMGIEAWKEHKISQDERRQRLREERRERIRQAEKKRMARFRWKMSIHKVIQGLEKLPDKVAEKKNKMEEEKRKLFTDVFHAIDRNISTKSAAGISNNGGSRIFKPVNLHCTYVSRIP